MKNNITKEKGDIGVCAVALDLTKKDYKVFNTISEHLPFDVVAYKNKKFYRIQVKYREMKNGKVEVQFRSIYSNSKGTHISFSDKEEIDFYAIYCPDTEKCYYVNCSNFNKSVALRIEKPKNNKSEGINFADDFLELKNG